jgi:aromatic ring-opening dioxygenase LigB subunit
MTPLWFLGHDRHLVGLGNVLATAPEADVGPPAVLITPSRSLPWETMVKFGMTVAKVAEESERRVFFVASCDWGHTHKPDGPYGYHQAAADMDARVVDAVRANALESLLSFTSEDVENAAIDGLWQSLMLAGVQQRVPLASSLLSYEAPSYYGMIVATFARDGAQAATES